MDTGKREITLLDCTLRDGGYVNDWEFGHGNLVSIFERLVDSGVDVIETCFLDDRRPFDKNRSIMPDTASAKKIWESVGKRPPMVVGMIDYGTCAIENLEPASESFFDGIRVIFKKHRMHEAMEYCAQVKALGYKVYSQLVSITAYTDEELKELVGLVNEVKPYAVSMVDTYGLLNPKWLLHYYEILDEYVDDSVRIGFHAHNNFQLAYANVMAFLEKEARHNILVDSTLFGMGKSAGNAPSELVAMHLNEEYGKSYDVRPMLEAIEESVQDFYRTSPWGYKIFFYLCAKNKCHPSYETYFMRKDNLSISSLDDIMGWIEPEPEKLLYNVKTAEQTYQDYLEKECSDDADAEKFGEALKGRPVLVLGPGKNIQLQKKKVDEYIEKHHPITISINYIPGAFDVDYVFTTNRRRYQQLTDVLKEVKNRDTQIIATTNLSCRDGEFAYIFNRAPLLEPEEDIKDNSFMMLLKILHRVGVRQLACAGLDGYSDREDNYYNSSMEYSFVKAVALHLNSHMRKVIYEDYPDMEIDFITYSHYTEVEDSHTAAF